MLRNEFKQFVTLSKNKEECFKCDECEKTFDTNKGLKLHMRIHVLPQVDGNLTLSDVEDSEDGNAVENVTTVLEEEASLVIEAEAGVEKVEYGGGLQDSVWT